MACDPQGHLPILAMQDFLSLEVLGVMVLTLGADSKRALHLLICSFLRKKTLNTSLP